MNKKLVLGIIISAGLVYLSLQNVSYADLVTGLGSFDHSFLPALLTTLVAIQVLRTYRWGLILIPLGRIDYGQLFSITSVGYLAVLALPARLGELVRPYLITKKSDIRLSSALATILVERVFDILFVLLMALALVFFTPLPPWLITSGILFTAFALSLLLLTIFMTIWRKTAYALLRPVLQWLPVRYRDRITETINHFLEGLQILVQEKKLLVISFTTALIWLLHVLVIYLLFLAFNMSLPVIAAFVLLVILIAGIAIPAAPGFIGNWHYVTILSLGLFQVSHGEALTFAVFHHFLSVGTVVALGLIFLPFHLISLLGMKKNGMISGKG